VGIDCSSLVELQFQAAQLLKPYVTIGKVNIKTPHTRVKQSRANWLNAYTAESMTTPGAEAFDKCGRKYGPTCRRSCAWLERHCANLKIFTEGPWTPGKRPWVEGEGRYNWSGRRRRMKKEELIAMARNARRAVFLFRPVRLVCADDPSRLAYWIHGESVARISAR